MAMKSSPLNAESFAQSNVPESSLPELVRGWNETSTDYPRERTVAQLFEEVAAARPDSIAVEFRNERLTYSELNARANRVAHRLRRMGVGAETMVGCCINRSLEAVVAFIGILKAGGAYVPLDLSYPKERLDFMLEDTRTAVMLTQRPISQALLGQPNMQTVCMDEFDAASSPDDEANLPSGGGPTSLAYVMYTSGSTGRPKGVMVENRAIVRLVRDTNFCDFGANEVFLQFAPASFDASTLEIWGPLLNGGKLVIMPPQSASLEDLGRTIREHGVTVLWLTSGLFNLMVEQRLEDLRSIRQLIAGGDVLSPRHVRTVLEHLPDCRLINGYGPTENTTFTCCHTMRHGDRVPETIPIGKPISNTQVYILDERMNPVPSGQTGELYAAGDGVARGYLNNPDATAEKFVANPFAPGENGRMYRTGDLACWREDGVIEFLGRIDNQVKILGHRIEPGEVETVLRMNKDVSQVCVVADSGENGLKRLVAYYVASAAPGPSPSDLRKFLAGKLPHYMVPALFVPLSVFPLSPNGKVDRAALPAPAAVASVESSPADVPATQLEKALIEHWQRILQVDHVTLDDNFFDLGGDSLMIVAIHSNLQKILQIEIPVTDLFEFTTIRSLASHLGDNQPAAPSFSDVQRQAKKQREAFERQRQLHADGLA
jgi:amino acid adenylation domain-containing protein